ncbi:MAG: OmpA family protein [Acidobacteria bacterium]|nr:OmpA family protein [Acidobacteriota bacterium]
MWNKTRTFLLAFGFYSAGIAYAQTLAPNPTQQQPPTAAAADNQTPLFRVTVVGRTTPAINYRPRSGDTRIDFAGTPLMPLARGKAEVSGEQGYIEVKASFDKMSPATQFGREYLTYVLWAVTPEGRATNLGEVQLDDDDAKVEVTTELQAFGLIVTAEPYFAVTQPSDVVVMENVVREGTKGTQETIQAKYELLKRGTYLMNQDANRLKLKPLEPGAPSDLAQARMAVELARLARADQYATETFNKAADLLATAEQAREKRRRGNEVMMPARQAAQTAEDARLVGLQRQEEEYEAVQRRQAQAREDEALERAKAEEFRRRQAELDVQNATAARANAEQNAAAARADAEQARAAAEQARTLAEQSSQTALAEQAAALRAKADADAARAAAEAVRLEAENARAQAEQARLDAEARATDAQRLAAQSEQEKAALRDRLREQLNVILETRETARGLIVNLSDVLFDTASANLKPGAREKLARVSGILSSHPGLKLEVEGHTDSVGTDEYNQRLSERRADSVRTYLVQQRIEPGAVVTLGLGESHPVATNETAAGRQQNRRVEIIVSGEAIGTANQTASVR